MYDLIYHKGHVVAYINLGSIFSEPGNTRIGSLSGGKMYSVDGKVLGSFRGANDPDPDKSLSAALRTVLNLVD